MSEYQLYCFAQSGNAYRAALMLNLIGADWEPVWIDFFGKGVQRTPEYRTDVNEMGEVPVLVHGKRKLTQSGVILTYLSKRHRKVQARGTRTSELEALRWIIFDNQKVNGFLGPFRFLKNFRKAARRPGSIGVSQGAHRRQPCYRQQAIDRAAVPRQRQADDRRYFDDRLSLLSGRGIRIRYRQRSSGDRSLARTHESAAGLEASL